MSTGRVFGGICAALILVACSSSGTSEDTVVQSTVAQTLQTMVETTTTSGLQPGDTIAREDIPPLALYLAAIDRGLMDTAYEGDVYLDPDGYVSVGLLFCSLLDADVTPTGVLESYIAALEAESDQLLDDDLLLGGVILGASVQLICPDYLDALLETTGG